MAVFLIVTLLPFAAVLYFSLTISQDQLTREITSRLEAIMDSKDNRFNGYLSGLLREVKSLTKTPDILFALETLAQQHVGASDTDSGGLAVLDQNSQERIDLLLDKYRRSFEYDDLIFLSKTGIILASVQPQKFPVGRNFADAAYSGTAFAFVISRSQVAFDAVFSQLVHEDDPAKTHGFLATPVVADGVHVGFLVAQVNAQRFIGILGDLTHVGDTGRILLAVQEPARVTSFDKSGAERLFKFDMASAMGVALMDAVNGGSGSGVLSDWDGNEVLAVWRNVSGSDRAIMIMTDSREALASVNRLAEITTVIFGITLAVLIAAAALLSRTVSVPIGRLAGVTNKITHGDYSERVDVSGEDEIAALGRDFNRMLDLVVQYQDGLKENLAKETRLGEELKERNKALKVAISEATVADRAKSDFLANMSHEIRTPMNGLLGMLTLLSESGLDQDRQRQVAIALRSGHNLLTVLNDVLDISRLDTGSLNLQLRPVHIAELMSGIAVLFDAEAQKKGIDIRQQIEIDPALELLVDEARLQQVLSNLMSNAVKFTEARTVTLAASARETGSGTYRLSVSVRDTGIGFDMAEAETLFERFQQADTSHRRAHQGTGLGLSICNELIALMGGTLTTLSEPGAGSRFTFEIDAARAVEAAPAPPAPAVPESDGKALRILIVEDNEINRLLLESILSRWGYARESAEDGLAALDLLDQVEAGTVDPFDIILMDIQMPRLDGIETTRRIRGRSDATARLPIIAVTAHAHEEQRQTYLDAGMDAHVPKPIDPGGLHSEIIRLTA